MHARNLTKQGPAKFSAVVFVALLAVGGFAVPGQAATLQVKCPANQVTIDVATRLTGPWWSTPQGARLHDVDIARVGGDPTLICLYRYGRGKEYSVLRKYPPRYTSCEARRSQRDFVCRN